LIADLDPRSAGAHGLDLVQLFDALFLHASDCVLLTRTDGTVLRANPAACKVLERTETEILREGRPGLVVPDAMGARMLAERARSGVATGELTFRKPDGRTFVADVTSPVIREAGGQLYAYVIFRDATARRVNARLEEGRKEYLEAVLDAALDGFFVSDHEGRLVDVNPAYCEMSGYTREELLKMRVSDVEANESPEETASHIRRVRERGFDRFDTRHRRKDGTIRVVSASVKVVGLGRGLIVCSFQDVTELRRAEAAALEREAQLRAYFETPAVGVAITSPAKGWLRVNDRACAMLGYSREELSSKTWIELTHPDDVAADVGEFNRLVAGEIDRYSLDKRFIRKDGAILWTLLSVSCARRPDGSVEFFVAILKDIGQRRRAEFALRESEARFRVLANEAPVGIFQTDPQGQLAFVNPTFLTLTGLSETGAIGSEMTEIAHPDDRDRVLEEWREAFSSGVNFSSEYRHRLRDGKVIWIRAFGAPLKDGAGGMSGYVGALIDITEPRALQAQLAVTSRLAAMGTLVAGVAHEINNPLAGEMASQAMAAEEARKIADHLRRGGQLDRDLLLRYAVDVIDLLGDAQVGADRIARIVKDLSVFGRPDLNRRPVRLCELVESALRWLPALTAKGTTVRVECAAKFEVMASEGQLEQVIVNLVSNASLAIPAGRPGEITIRIGHGEHGMARLDVEDNGTGIAPDLIERVFDPFYSTRDVGKGMGLGLPICHAIVTAHGGTLTATSVPGTGSTFRVELPTVAGED
jgi:PAS domain S-box-containing protein